MKTKEEACAQFSVLLNEFILLVRDRALAQFTYNIEKNVPKGILAPEECANHALRHGIVGAINMQGQWSCENAVAFASDILEDANCHSENNALLGMAKQNGLNISAE
jgi:hypothetical protein